MSDPDVRGLIVTDVMIDAALKAIVPGGAEVKAWLPSIDGHEPHPTARVVMRAALSAALTATTASPDGGQGK